MQATGEPSRVFPKGAFKGEHIGDLVKGLYLF